ncbi:MAG: RNA methyltransferase [Bdellovibrio sp.]
MMSLSSEDKKRVEEIHSLFLQMERDSQDGKFPAEDLRYLKSLISSLALSENPEVHRLAALEKHLVSTMSLKHFVSFAVPVERLLHKNIQDDDFLILEGDRDIQSEPTVPLAFVLDNIRSAFNVGSIFRTAECLGAEKIYLCGYTPLPTQWKLAKTAMGAQEMVAWEEKPQLLQALEELKEQGYHIVALETAARAADLCDAFPRQPTAFVLGNERFGLDPEVLKVIDDLRAISLRGRKNSLNVGVAAAVAGFEWVRQWKTSL